MMTSVKNYVKLLLPLTLPLFLELILRSLMGTVNTYVISSISDNASASVGIANQILNVSMLMSTMLASGAAIILNQALGAKDTRRAEEITSVSFSLTILAGILVSVILRVFSRTFVRAMGLEESMIADSCGYLNRVGSFYVIQFTFAMLAQHFRCRKQTFIPMIAIIAANLCNVTGSFLVIRGHILTPSVESIALIRVLSEAVSLLILLCISLRARWGVNARDMLKIGSPTALKILRLGFMSGLEGFSYTTAQLFTTRFVTTLPAFCLSAKVYTQTLNGYAPMLGQATGQAAQILAGYSIGAEDEDGADKLIRKSWIAVTLCDFIGCTTMRILAVPLVGMFTDSKEIIALSATLLSIDILSNFARSMNHSFNFGLRSAGYVFYPMIIASSSIWIIQVGLAWLFVCRLNLGLPGLWLAQMSDEWVRGLLSSWLWLSGKWRKRAVSK